VKKRGGRGREGTNWVHGEGAEVSKVPLVHCRN